MVTEHALLELDAMAERCRLRSRLGKEFDAVTAMDKAEKEELRCFWLVIWVRRGMHPVALLNECLKLNDEVLDSLAAECTRADTEANMALSAVNEQAGNIDFRTEPKTSGAERDQACEAVAELQERWLRAIAPPGELFCPGGGYVDEWQRICAEHRRHARQERRRNRGRAGTTATKTA